MREALLAAGILLGLSSTAFAEDALTDEAAPDVVSAYEEPFIPVDVSDTHAAERLALHHAQRELRLKGRGQIGPAPILLITSSVFLVPLLVAEFPEGRCESNKYVCGPLSPGDYSSVGDDFAAAFSFAGVSSGVVGTALLTTIGVRNRQLARGDFQSVEELEAARGRMLVQYGTRTRWAGAGLMIGGATAALTGGVLSLAYLGDCEVGDCRVVPGAIKTLFIGVGMSAVTGGMMMAVGKRTIREGQELLTEPAVAISVAPWFDPRGGGGATMAMSW